MGFKVINWSPIHGQGNTTSNMTALCLLYAIENQEKALITHSQLQYSSMEFLLNREQKDLSFADSGVKAIERLMRSRLLKANSVEDYTDTILKERLDLLGGSSEEVDKELLKTVIEVASDLYDIIWVDAHSGTRNEANNELLTTADVVFVHLPQNKFILDDFFLKNGGVPKNIANKPHVFIISQYDEKSNFNAKKMKRIYGIDKPIFTIPYSSNFKNASNQQRVVEFILKKQKVKKSEDDFKYISSLSVITKHLAKGVKLEREREE